MIETKKIRTKTKGWEQHSFCALLFVLALLTLSALTSCSGSNNLPEANSCETRATVKNLQGLDGCNYVLELVNGQKLEPILDAAQPSPTIKGIVLRDGMRVSITYHELKDRASICMVGKIVEVTCISEIKGSGSN